MRLRRALFVSFLLVVVASSAAASIVVAMGSPDRVGYTLSSSVHSYRYVPPGLEAIHEADFATLYRACGNVDSTNGRLYYVGTLLAGTLGVSLYRDIGSDYMLVIYHVGGRVLWCSGVELRPVKVGVSGQLELGKGVAGSYTYSIYAAYMPLPPSGVLVADTSLSREAALLAKTVVYEYRVGGTVVYSFERFGKYVVHLGGYVWIKEEAGGNREVIDAAEAGSYTERQGLMQYLFSECSFKAWAEHNKFAGFIKASWAIAENTCPVTARYKGRPVLKVGLDGSLELLPGGPSGGNEIGCGCHAWSP